MSDIESPGPFGESQSHDLPDDSGEAIFVLDQNGQCQDATRAAATLIGYRPDELRGMRIDDLLLPGQPPIWRTGGNDRVDLRHRAGHAVAVKISVSQLHWGGQPWLVAVAQAVEAPHKDGQELSHFNDQMDLAASLIESIGEAAIATDMEGRIIFWNRAAEKIYGWSREEVLGCPIVDVTPSDMTHAQAVQIMEKLLIGERWEGEFWVKRKSGEEFPAHVTDAPLFNKSGDMIGIIGISADITQVKKTETALLESEALYKSIISALSEGLVVQDLSDTILMANESAARILGLTMEQLVGKSSYDPRWQATQEDGRPFRPEDHPSLVTLRTGEPVDGTIMRVSVGDDVRVVISINSHPILDRNGQMAGVVATFADITEQKKAAEQYKAFFTENVSPVYWIEFRNPISIDLPVDEQVRRILHDGYIKDASATIAKMYGFASREAVMGKPLTEIFHADYYNGTSLQYRAIRQFVEKGYMDVESEGPELTRAGQPKWFLSTTTGVVEDGHLVRIWGSQVDITQRKEAEQALMRLNKAIEHSPVSVVITDTTGTIQYVNPKFCQVTGYTAEEAIGQNPRVLKSGHQSPEFYRSMWQTLSAGRDWQGEFHNRKKNGELYWELAFIAGVKDKQGVITHYIAVKEDITDRRQMEEAASRQERLAAVGQLAAGIAHDFNNILAVITLYTQMMERRSALSPSDREKLGIINQQAWHASRLVEQILDFSRKSVLRRQTFDLLPLIKEQITLLDRTLPENITIELRHDAGAFAIHADSTRMQQIVTNLAVNARDAMPGGGQLRIKLGRIKVEPDQPAPYPTLTPGPWIRLVVSDTGSGIKDEVLPRIFDPFFTTKGPGEGSGLGLAQVHGIVGQHGGYIDVASTLNKGTSFTIYLPATEIDESSAQSATEASDLPLGQKEIVLVVEDEKILRRSIADILETWNFRVIEAKNGQEALTLLAEQTEEAALVISDVTMPIMGGIPLLGALRDKGKTMPVILMSGHPKTTDVAELHTQGLSAWLTKPLSLATLAQAVQEAIGRKKP